MGEEGGGWTDAERAEVCDEVTMIHVSAPGRPATCHRDIKPSVDRQVSRLSRDAGDDA